MIDSDFSSKQPSIPTPSHEVTSGDVVVLFSKLFRLSLVHFPLVSRHQIYFYLSSLVISNRLLYFQAIWALLVLLRLFFFNFLKQALNILFFAALGTFSLFSDFSLAELLPRGRCN